MAASPETQACVADQFEDVLARTPRFSPLPSLCAASHEEERWFDTTVPRINA